MINWLRKVIFKIFIKIIPINYFVDAFNQEKKKTSLQYCKVDQSTFIHTDARIINLQNNPDKIIIGRNSIIRGELFINEYGGQIVFGNNSSIGENSKIWSSEKVLIGDYVQISHNVNIIDTNTHSLDYQNRIREYDEIYQFGNIKKKNDIKSASIIIEDNVWISFNVTILKGVRIGEGAIVAANTLVVKDVPPMTLVGGSPAKVLKQL